MPLKNTTEKYGSVAKFLHWLIALLIIAMLFIGYFMGSWGNAIVYNVHKLTGLSILLLIIFRMIWALMNRRPRLPEGINKLEKILAHSVQGLLYLCLLIMPLSGWAMSTASGHYPHFGSALFPMPGIPLNPSLAGLFFEIHAIAAIILMSLISLHILGALKHHFIDKNMVLKSMLPGFSVKNNTKSTFK